MRRRVKMLMFLFMVLLTAAVFVYAAMFVLLNDATLRQLHEQMPVVNYISSFLGVYDTSYQYDDIYQMKQRIGSNLEGFVDRKQTTGGNPRGEHRLKLADDRPEIALYSPIWTFAGETSGNLERVQLIFSHKGRDVTRVFEITTERTLDGYRRQHEVHLGKESLFNGINDYLIEASFADGEVISRKVTLLVDYQRIQVGDVVIYVDPGYIPADASEDIIWEAPDFDGEMTNFISYGCDISRDAPPILLQQTYQYRPLPACLTFSPSKNYLLWFAFRQQSTSNREYDVISPKQGVLYRHFPLFVQDLNTTYMSLVFRDPLEKLLKILSSRGDQMSHALEIIYYDPATQRSMVKITQTDANKLVVENEREKMYVYLYKDRSYTTGLLYPGVRYKFRYKGKEINQGPMYTLPIRLYSPTKPFTSTFTFTIYMDGTRLYIDDGIKLMSFDIGLIGQTIEVESKEYPQAQPGVCDNIVRDIYQNTRGDDLMGARVQDSLWLVAEGVHASTAKIYHEETKRLVEVEQLYQGWLHLRINSERGTLVRGENTYQLRLYNEKEKEVCRVEKKIEVK